MNGESVQLDCGRILEIRRFISWPASPDQTWQPPLRVSLPSVPPCARSVALKFAPGPQARLSANGPTRKPKDWLAPRLPARPNCVTAALRPACRSIPAAKFRHAAELYGATRAALNSPPNALRNQRRFRCKTAGHRRHVD